MAQHQPRLPLSKHLTLKSVAIRAHVILISVVALLVVTALVPHVVTSLPVRIMVRMLNVSMTPTNPHAVNGQATRNPKWTGTLDEALLTKRPPNVVVKVLATGETPRTLKFLPRGGPKKLLLLRLLLRKPLCL
jgi:hypothetical protein